MTKTLINICGSERSGSTMLDLIIGNDPKAFSCGEIYALYRPWRKHHFQPVCGCGEKCDYLEEFKKTGEDQCHQVLFEKFGFDWVVDSSKDLTWVIDNQQWIHRQGGQVLNLVIWKTPTTFSLSFLKRGKDADYWRPIFIDYYRKVLETQLPFLSICYDDFVKNPEENIKMICTLIGMDYHDRKLNFWEKTHHQLFGSGGTARQVNNGKSEIFQEEELFDNYDEQVKSIELKLAHDKEVASIIGQLREKDISTITSKSNTIINRSKRGHRPLWYYLQKMNLKLKRHFPVTME